MLGLVVVRGMGSIGARHARVFRSLGYDVRGWPVRPRGAATETGRFPLLTDHEAAALMGSAELVVICTDTARHVDDALEALNAGAPRVLVEKPLAPVVAEIDRLLAHPASDRGVTVAAPLRAHLGFLHFHAAVARLETPRFATVYAQSWLPSWRPGRDYRESYSARADEGGALRDLVHEIDYATVALGTPRKVLAVLEHSGPLKIQAEQAATLLWETDTGVVTIRVDYVTRPSRRGAVVTSPSGSVAWNPAAASVTVVDADGRSSTTITHEDLDRDLVMARQAQAALTMTPATPPPLRLAAGAPASLAEGVLDVQICDDARAFRPERGAGP